MRLTCDICGEKEKVSVWLMWYYMTRAWRDRVLHLKCAQDMEDQRRLDGLDG